MAYDVKDQMTKQAQESLRVYKTLDISNLSKARVMLDTNAAMVIGVKPESIGDLATLIRITEEIQGFAEMTMRQLLARKDELEGAK